MVDSGFQIIFICKGLGFCTVATFFPICKFKLPFKNYSITCIQHSMMALKHYIGITPSLIFFHILYKSFKLDDLLKVA